MIIIVCCTKVLLSFSMQELDRQRKMTAAGGDTCVKHLADNVKEGKGESRQKARQASTVFGS